MFKAYYKAFKSPANIYSIDKYRDTLSSKIDPSNDNHPICWLIVSMKELYILRGNENDEVTCTLVHDPRSQLGLDYVSCKTFNLKSKPFDPLTMEGNEQYMWVIAQQVSQIE